MARFIKSIFRSPACLFILVTVMLMIAYFAIPGNISNLNVLRRGYYYGSNTFDDWMFQSDYESKGLITGTNTELDLASTPANSNMGSDTMYFRTAIIITLPDGGIGVRLTLLKECGNKRNATMRIGKLEMPLLMTTVRDYCPWKFVPRCNFVGYFAIGNITSDDNQAVPLPPILPDYAEIYDDWRDEWKRIDLVDGRSVPVRPHRLAVCLQPIFLMANWPLIASFFETWIGHGATIFYIYVHSISEEVDLMIKLYEAQRDIEVVRVNWPSVPTSEEDDIRNPNNRMFRTEVTTSINDCILRARATAELAVSSDLDEIIAPLNSNETLFDVIYDYQARKMENDTLPGAFMFLHSYAYAEHDWFSISHPDQLKFDHYRSVDYDVDVLHEGKSKVIYVPDRIFRAYIHSAHEFESEQWATSFIDPNRARIFHFRQVANEDMRQGNVISDSEVLKGAVAGWQASYDARLTAAIESEREDELKGAFNLSFSTPAWPNLGEQVLHELDRCHGRIEEPNHDTCVTEWHCRATMHSLRPGQWVEPDAAQAWTVI